MTKGKGRVQTWIVMGAAIFVVLYVLTIFVYDKYTIPGRIAAFMSSPPFSAVSPGEGAPSGVVLPLAPLNGSGEEGIVTFRASEGKTVVVVALRGAPATPQPAHIHAGQCPGVGAVRYPLNNVVKGVSETTLGVPLTQVLSALPLAVNVHASAQDMKTYVACGAIADY